jgi:hypothetical protein
LEALNGSGEGVDSRDWNDRHGRQWWCSRRSGWNDGRVGGHQGRGHTGGGRGEGSGGSQGSHELPMPGCYGSGCVERRSVRWVAEA